MNKKGKLFWYHNVNFVSYMWISTKYVDIHVDILNLVDGRQSRRMISSRRTSDVLQNGGFNFKT